MFQVRKPAVRRNTATGDVNQRERALWLNAHVLWRQHVNTERRHHMGSQSVPVCVSGGGKSRAQNIYKRSASSMLNDGRQSRSSRSRWLGHELQVLYIRHTYIDILKKILLNEMNNW